MPLAGLDAADRHNVQTTEDFKNEKTTRNEHKRRVCQFVEWLDMKYPGSDMVMDLDAYSDMAHAKDCELYANVTRRLNYPNLDLVKLKAFISSMKITNPEAPKAEQLYCSFSHVRKFRDCVKKTPDLFRTQNELPADFDGVMKTFVGCLNKETANAKQDGKVKEQDADPIPFALFPPSLPHSSSPTIVFVLLHY